MSYIERPRFSCMLGGALATISSLPKTVPIIHGAQGCGGNLSQAYSFGGYLGVGYCGCAGTPSSNVGEKEIIFGGEDRLLQEINATFEVMEGDLFIVVSSCMTDIIGDDISSVISQIDNIEKPLIYIDTGGFKGNSYYGYEKVIEELFQQFIEKTDNKKQNLVNLIGLIPGYDPHFRGDLEELKRVLNLVGIEANTFLTNDQTIENLKGAGSASLNIILSPIYGVEAAKIIKETHGIDYVVTGLPIGTQATTDFIKIISQKLQIDQNFVDDVLEKETDIYYKYLDRVTDVVADTDFQNYAVVIANATEALPYTKYLDNEIGWIPSYIFITDEISDRQKEVIKKLFNEIDFAVKPELVFETDTFKIQQYITQNNPQFKSDDYYETISPAFVLGSTLDKKLATVLKANLLSISYPVINRIIISKGYAGFKGGLNLLEDLMSAQVAGR